MTDEKIFVFLPKRRSEEVISLLLKNKELTLRLEESERFIEEQRIAIVGLSKAINKKLPIVINDRETNERYEYDLSATLPTVG